MSVVVKQGTTSGVNQTGTAIGSSLGGFDVSDAIGRDCLVPLSSGQPVRLGIIHVGDRDVVLWIDCPGAADLRRVNRVQPAEGVYEMSWSGNGQS